MSKNNDKVSFWKLLNEKKIIRKFVIMRREKRFCANVFSGSCSTP